MAETKMTAEQALERFRQDLLPDPHDEGDIDASWIRRRWEKYEPVIRQALSAPRVPTGFSFVDVVAPAGFDGHINLLFGDYVLALVPPPVATEIKAAILAASPEPVATTQHPCDVPGMCAKMNRRCDVCEPLGDK